MPKMSMQEFMQRNYSTGNFNNIIPLKKFGDGETTGWFHQAGLYERVVHGSIAAPKDDDDADKADYLFENCGGAACPLCVLKEWAVRAIDDGQPSENVILSGGPKAKTSFDYTLLELSGACSDTMRKVTDTRTLVVFPWISSTPARQADKPIVVLEGPAPSFGGRIRDAIKAKQKRRGQERGDPTINPWPLELVFDEVAGKKRGADYYKVNPVDESDLEMDADARALFEADLTEHNINMDELTGAGDCDAIMDFLQRAWKCTDEGCTFDDFRGFYDKRVAKFNGKPASKPETAGKAKPVAGKGKPAASKPKQTGTVCKTCDEPLDDGAKFCKACGEKVVAASADADDVPDTKCPHCKAMVIPTSSGRCPECGKKINSDNDPV